MRNVIGFGLIVFSLIALIFAGGIWAGFRLAEDLSDAGSVAARARVRLESYFNSYFRADRSTSRSIPALHLTLKEKRIPLPIEAEYFAGGISAFQGRSVLVLDRLGHIFHVENDRSRKLQIFPPDNRVSTLRRQIDEGRFGQADVDLKWFRYNDILHMQDGDRQWLLVSYTEWQPQDFCFNSAMARLDLPPGSRPEAWRAGADDWTVLARTAPCLPPNPTGHAIKGLEAGGRMLARDAHRVIWSSGSYERDDAYPEIRPLAQDDAGDYGKVLEVDLDSGALRHIAKGLRNPQGLAMDEAGGIWVTDHGMRGGDELNRVFEGANFGYPLVTYGTRYNRQPAGASGRHAGHEGFDKPMLAFVPGIAPGSAIVLKNFHYAWDGDILIGAFRGDLYRVHVEEGRAIFAERIEIGVRPRDMVMLEDGSFAVWTDFRQLIFYSVEEGADPVQPVLDRIAAIPAADLRHAVGQTFETCLSCHGMAPGEHGAGASLAGICGRSPGSGDFADYSGALGQIRKVWTTKSLAAFIADPQKIAPGTSMGWGPMNNLAAALALAEAICPTEG